MLKRKQVSNTFETVKKFNAYSGDIMPSNITSTSAESAVELRSELPNDTEAALIYLKTKFPSEKFNRVLPPIFLIHQIYSIVKNRTKVDNEVNFLQNKGKIRLFKLQGEELLSVLVFNDDLMKHIEEHCPQKYAVTRFVKQVLPDVLDVSIDKELLRHKYGFSEQDIRELMNCGLLALRFTTSYWFSFPNAGEYVRSCINGRKSILRTIKRCKFNEILQSELEQRKLEKSVKLGVQYQIHDIIGAELVTCVKTSSGTLLSLPKK